MARGSTVLDLRRRNRGRVLRNLVLTGESTRATLAHACDLSSATVTNVVSDLIAEGLVEEVGTVPSNGGRPISRLAPRGDAAYVIGADVGEHGIATELFDLGLQRIDRVFADVPTQIASPERIAETLGSAVGALRARNQDAEGRLIGIGLGLPGIVDTTPDGITTVDAQSLGWEAVELRDIYDDDSVAIFADNGAKTMTAAEAWRGRATDVEHCIVVLVGRGVGAGFIVNGKLLRGQSSSAGEWGHTKVSLGGRECGCGGQGCLEAYVGGAAIAERWKAQGGTPRGTEEEALTQLISATDAGDETARRVLDETVEILGTGLANLVDLFNPEIIIIGGWTGLELADARLEQLDCQLREQTLRRPGQQVRLVASELGRDAVALGAALLPLQQLIEGRLPPPELARQAAAD